MDNKATSSTKGMVLSLICATCFTVLCARGIWQLLIDREETWRTWLDLATIPVAVFFWIAFFRRVWLPVIPSGLDLIGFLFFLVICLVGWYRTEHGFLGLFVAFCLVLAGWSTWRLLRARR